MEHMASMVVVNGTHLYFEQAGSGHPLVLIHGFTLSTEMWEDQFAVFARHYRVIRYDMRGFGRSALPTEGPFRAVDDLYALLDALGVSRTFVLGLSMGGGVAIDFRPGPIWDVVRGTMMSMRSRRRISKVGENF